MLFEQFQEVLLSTAQTFRLGMEAQGSEGLVALIDALPLLLQGNSCLDSENFNHLLVNMVAAQTRKDYLYLADLLQYEVASFFISAQHLPVQ